MELPNLRKKREDFSRPDVLTYIWLEKLSTVKLRLDAAAWFRVLQTIRSTNQHQRCEIWTWRELIRGSDPPLVYSAHSMVGDVWRVPIRLLLKTHLAAGVYKNWDKNSMVSKGAKHRILSGFEGRPHENTQATSHALGHRHQDELSSALSPTLLWNLAQNEEEWSCGLSAYLEIEG